MPSRHAAGAWQARGGFVGVSHGRASLRCVSPTPVCFVPGGVSAPGWVPAPLWVHRTGNVSRFGSQPPRPDPAFPCPGKPSASLPPRALLRSMLQPLLTPRRDRWTRQGIACTGGTWLIPLAGLCLQPLALTLLAPRPSPALRQRHPPPLPITVASGHHRGALPILAACSCLCLSAPPAAKSSDSCQENTKSHQNLPKTGACWWR